MLFYMYFVTVFSLFMVGFKAGHLKGSKEEKFNVGEIFSMLPFAIQLVCGIAVIVKNVNS